jgi:hypothetical protein
VSAGTQTKTIASTTQRRSSWTRECNYCRGQPASVDNREGDDKKVKKRKELSEEENVEAKADDGGFK